VEFADRVSGLLGFQDSHLNRMALPQERSWIKLTNVLVVSAFLLMSISVGAMSWMFSSAEWWRPILAIVVAALFFVVLVSIHVLFVTLGAFPLNHSLKEIDHWRPHVLRLVVFFLLASVLSQPLLLGLQQDRLDMQVRERLEFKIITQFEGKERNQLFDKQQSILLDKSLLEDEYRNLQASTSNFSVTGVSSSRKALLVGASDYGDVRNNLPNARNDILAMQKKLTSLGYAVTVSLNDPHKVLKEKIQKYSLSLSGGDISLVYFSGHGIEKNGHNYFIPKDFAETGSIDPISERDLRSRAVILTPLIDDLTPAKLRLNLLLLDACRTDLDKAPKGLASMQSTTNKNVILVMAASPGQEALDSIAGQKGGNSPFTTALLKNIDRDEDAGTIFRRVTKEVVGITAETMKRENKPPQTPWVSESVTELEIKLIPPQLQTLENQSTQKSIQAIAPRCVAYQNDGNQTSDYANCIASAINALNRKIGFIEEQIGSLSGDSNAWLKRELADSVFFSERLRLMWTHYMVNGLGTLFLAALMTAGIFMRDFWKPSALRSYESIRYQSLKNILRNHHLSFQDSIDANLYAYHVENKIPRYEHWSREHDFYTSEAPPSAIATGIETRFSAIEEQKMWNWLSTTPVEGSLS